MSRSVLQPSQQKLAEKLTILNDRGVGMLTRLYNIKKVRGAPAERGGGGWTWNRPSAISAAAARAGAPLGLRLCRLRCGLAAGPGRLGGSRATAARHGNGAGGDRGFGAAAASIPGEKDEGTEEAGPIPAAAAGAGPGPGAAPGAAAVRDSHEPRVGSAAGLFPRQNRSLPKGKKGFGVKSVKFNFDKFEARCCLAALGVRWSGCSELPWVLEQFPGCRRKWSGVGLGEVARRCRDM